MKLVTFGDLNLDVCLDIPAFPQAGQDAVVDRLVLLPGGSAANCAVAAARLGVAVTFIGITGRDPLSRMLAEDLRASGVDTRHLRQSAHLPGIIIAVNEASGERTFFSYRGANALTEYGPLPPDLLAPGDVLHLSGYSLQSGHSRVTALALIEQAGAVGARVSLDPSFHFAGDQTASALLPHLAFIFPNQDEARLLTGIPDPQEAAARLRKAGVQTVVITLGAMGCYVDCQDAQTLLPVYPVAHIADSVGAGDAFCGGFLAATIYGLNAVDAAHVGQAVAALVIGQAGGHQGAPTLESLIAADWLDGSVRTRLAGLIGRQSAPRT